MITLPEHTRAAKLLIVDDNLTNVILLQKLLESVGFTDVEGVTDPREVKPKHDEKHYDLILLDIRMPHLDGYGVMMQLKESVPDGDYLPVMVLTAQTDQETKLKALEHGAQDFLHKPFDQVEVLTRIRNMIEVRLLHNQVRDQNLILEERVKERTAELEQTRLDVVRCLGRAAEYKDNETGAHVIRMSTAAKMLAELIGLDQRTCDLLLHAAPMHDIGKIGIPDDVLLKPGKLTPEEFDVIKLHAEMGAEILGDHPTELMQMAREVALTHHEKWDGSGYPNGLKGEEIPITGRITALADVFDALTSSRPYKKAWSTEDAVKFIADNAGSHFDPALAARFPEIVDKVVALREEFSDDEEQAA